MSEDKDALLKKRHAKLKQLRTRTDLKLPSTPYLKDSFEHYGREIPLQVRYYQVQGIMHLVSMNRFLLGDDCGLGKCTVPSARVLTDRGLIPIGSLAPEGDLSPDTFYPVNQPTRVWTGWEWAPVKSYYHCGVKPTVTVRTRRGYETTGSLVHPLWARQKGGESFVRLMDVREGEYLCIDRSGAAFPDGEPDLPIPDPAVFGSNAKVYEVPARLTPALAALLGYVVGEGHTNSPYHVSISQHREINPEVHDHIRDLCGEVFGWQGNDSAQNRDVLVQLSSVYLRSYLAGLGVGMEVAAGKQVPWPVFQGTRESVTGFLRALFDGEGSVAKGCIEVSSASETLMRDVQILLLRFGIICSRKPKKVRGREHTYWRLTISGDDARAFAHKIGFLTPRKRDALQELLKKTSNTNLDVVPHAREEVEALRAEIMLRSTRRGSNSARVGSGIKQFGVGFEKALNNIRNCGQNPTYSFLQQMLEAARVVGADDTDAYNAVSALCENRFFYDPIVEVTKGEQEVADIEVDHSRHSFVANGFINHNTLQTIGGLALLWKMDPKVKAIVLTTKSATVQWASEFNKFTKGVNVFVGAGSPTARQKAREQWSSAEGPSVLIMGYRSAVNDIAHIHDWSGYVLITDEAQAYKSPDTQVHKVVRHLSTQAARTWALTATLIKNNLVEGFGIYQVVVPGLFGSKAHFMENFCITRMQQLPKSNRKIPVIVGYRDKDIREFKDLIDPYFLSRAKMEVATELPSLTTKTIDCTLSKPQALKYQEALSGLLEVGRDDRVEEKEVTKLTAVTYCQQIANHPELIDCDGSSDKLATLIEMLTEGDLADEKVIIFSRFSRMVDILMRDLKKAKVPAVRITGAENGAQRKTAQDVFQDPNSDVKVICITTAATEAVNLQTAKAIVFYDTPWSAGDYIQALGRMIRIGSVHDRVYAYHMICKGTIDERVMAVLDKKMDLVQKVIGKRIKGEDDDDLEIKAENDLSDLFDMLRQDALKKGV